MPEEIHESIQSMLQDVALPTKEQEPQANMWPVDDKSKQSGKSANTSDAGNENIHPELDPELLASSADLSIALFGLAQSTIFRWLVNKRHNAKIIRLFGDDALDKLERLINERDAMDDKKSSVTIIRQFTAEELMMIKIAAKTDEILEDMPLRDDEKDFIKIPLMEIMKKRGGTLPPEYALLLGILTISGGRIAEIYMT